MTSDSDSSASTAEPVPRPRDVSFPFSWKVYADATCAGLTALIPIPLLDLAFEAVFRHRMPAAILVARGESLEIQWRRRLGRRKAGWSLVDGCLAVPLLLARYVARKLWRKLIYIFAITDAAAQVSAYWHRAALLDHMVRAGHLRSGTDRERAVRAFQRALAATDTGSLAGVAMELISGGSRLLGTLVRARREGAARATRSLGAFVEEHWARISDSMERMARLYNHAYLHPDDDRTR